MTRLFAVLLAALCALVLVAGAAPATTKAVAIKVTIRDTAFVLSKKTAPAGTVIFTVKNAGKLSHSFAISTKKTPVLKAGKTAKLTVVFKKAGAFTYHSTVAGQKKLKGVFKVTAPKPSTPGSPTAGKVVFTTTGGCGSCHTLKAAGTTGTIGPNLGSLSLSFATIVTTVTNGKSGSAGAMPPFKGTLSTKQIQDVAAFVYQSEH
ncbi:MAG TPA: c-type cytochrome [Gaiellaceae bacterium]|jgi:mono/diheme cytochrome c family protein